MMITNERFFVGTNDGEIEVPSMKIAEKILDVLLEGRNEGDYDRIECLDEVVETFDEYHVHWTWDTDEE